MRLRPVLQRQNLRDPQGGRAWSGQGRRGRGPRAGPGASLQEVDGPGTGGLRPPREKHKGPMRSLPHLVPVLSLPDNLLTSCGPRSGLLPGQGAHGRVTPGCPGVGPSLSVCLSLSPQAARASPETEWWSPWCPAPEAEGGRGDRNGDGNAGRAGRARGPWGGALTSFWHQAQPGPDSTQSRHVLTLYLVHSWQDAGGRRRQLRERWPDAGRPHVAPLMDMGQGSPTHGVVEKEGPQEARVGAELPWGTGQGAGLLSPPGTWWAVSCGAARVGLTGPEKEQTLQGEQQGAVAQHVLGREGGSATALDPGLAAGRCEAGRPAALRGCRPRPPRPCRRRGGPRG